MNELDSRTARRLKAIETALAEPMTANELAVAISAVPQSALEYIRHLMAEPKRIHVAAWRRTPGHIVAVYRWGPGKDAKKPRAKTAGQSQRERIKRLRKDGDGYERLLARHRARYARMKAAKTPNTWLSALGVQP